MANETAFCSFGSAADLAADLLAASPPFLLRRHAVLSWLMREPESQAQ